GASGSSVIFFVAGVIAFAVILDALGRSRAELLVVQLVLGDPVKRHRDRLRRPLAPWTATRTGRKRSRTSGMARAPGKPGKSRVWLLTFRLVTGVILCRVSTSVKTLGEPRNEVSSSSETSCFRGFHTDFGFDRRTFRSRWISALIWATVPGAPAGSRKSARVDHAARRVVSGDRLSTPSDHRIGPTPGRQGRCCRLKA